MAVCRQGIQRLPQETSSFNLLCGPSFFQAMLCDYWEMAMCIKSDVAVGCLCSLCMPCLACTLPSLHLIYVVCCTAISTSLYIFDKCLLNTCLCTFFLYNSTLNEDIVLASFFQTPPNKSVIKAAFAMYQGWRYGSRDGLEHALTG